MKSQSDKLVLLRQVINENLRIQRAGLRPPAYIDVGNVLSDICARQSHVVFARRGCGKTLLLHDSSRRLNSDTKAVYLNCEDFKHHSFPNVLIEILDALFGELERHLTGWFGRKRKSRELIQKVRKELYEKRLSADVREEEVTSSRLSETTLHGDISGGAKDALATTLGASKTRKDEIQRAYKVLSDKVSDLDMWLPRLKHQVREFFDVSSSVKAVFLQIDDLYHLKRTDQPFVVDYIHRLCKDLPLYFKIATLRHASTLYADREGQPIGAQERHDYQPINIDYTFGDFRRTRDQNRRIFDEFGKLAGMNPEEVASLFKGVGFDRLVMAGGGVPRDTLSLFIEVLSHVQAQGGSKIGKDEVRILSRSNFERRIEELKQDSEGREQDTLMKGIYVLRGFCLGKRSNVFVISEQMMQQRDEVRSLIYRLLDYRIIHNCGGALTHKSQPGTYQAFAIDIGCYAHLRKLDGRFSELDVSSSEAKEKMRSAPVLDEKEFEALWSTVPSRIEDALLADPTGSSDPT